MSQPPIHKHGRTQFYIEGEGLTPEVMPSPRLRALGVDAVAGAAAFKMDAVADSAAFTMVAEAVQADEEERAFRFCRLFPNLARFQPDDAKLIALGQALAEPAAAGSGDSRIPAGFTYLGQFIDHDITFDRTEGIPAGTLEPEEIEQGRSPALELDSVYGRGPTLSPELYEDDGVRLRVGRTVGRDIFKVTAEFPNDLPRHPADHPDQPGRAIIGDPRNDENLIVAQTHLAFLKFHNAVVDRLEKSGADAGTLFEKARETVVQHYQSIVLHDFVPRLAHSDVVADVLANGRKFYFPQGAPGGSRLCMPIEFSVAAYRLGHSMIRNAYQWNRVFSSTGPAGFAPGLILFFEFSRVSGSMQGFPSVPSDWIVDWRRMFDFGEQSGGTRHPQLNFTRPIDTQLAEGLSDLPEFSLAEQQHLKSLAVRNLLRGRLVGLPSGQEVAAAVGARQPLTPAELASGAQAAIVLAQGFDRETPLWFYILKEAEVRQGGLCLGEVGSRLVAETFHGLVEGSDHSILKVAGWKPSLPARDPGRFTMNDLLLFVDDLNPLGD